MKLRQFIYILWRTTTLCSIEHQMTEIYCFIDDYLKAHPKTCRLATLTHNSQPAFTDAEVLTSCSVARLLRLRHTEESLLAVGVRTGAPPSRIWSRTNSGLARLHALSGIGRGN